MDESITLHRVTSLCLRAECKRLSCLPSTNGNEPSLHLCVCVRSPLFSPSTRFSLFLPYVYVRAVQCRCAAAFQPSVAISCLVRAAVVFTSVKYEARYIIFASFFLCIFFVSFFPFSWPSFLLSRPLTVRLLRTQTSTLPASHSGRCTRTSWVFLLSPFSISLWCWPPMTLCLRRYGHGRGDLRRPEEA